MVSELSLVQAFAMPKIAWGHAVPFAEDAAEMGEVVEPPAKGDLADMAVRQNWA